jgi:hypothetical protein
MNGPVDIALFTVRQRRTDPALMGRAFATSMALNFLGFPVGSAISGGLVDISLAGTVAFGVASFAAAGLAAWLFLPANHPAETGLEDVSGTTEVRSAATAGTRRP